MDLLGYMAVSAAFNILDFIADDLVTLKCFGVDTFCDNSIKSTRNLVNEEIKEDDEGDATETEDFSDSSSGISLCNRLFNLEFDEILDYYFSSDESEDDDFEDDQDEEDAFMK